MEEGDGVHEGEGANDRWKEGMKCDREEERGNINQS